tara:strand:- start:94 stop:1542 length:1449 start_codon:yes stop_codon:yes gene_type:complete
MDNFKNKKTYQILFNIFLFLVLPTAVLAPMGTWIPLIIMALITFSSIKSFKNLIFDKKYIILLSTFILTTLLSYFLFNFEIKNIIRLISLYFILFSFLSVLSLYEVKNNFKSTTIQLVISLILSCLIIIIDYNFQLGLKLWLSDNLDFKNFNHFYSFKKWISFTEFQKNHQLIIENYLGNTYDRGIAAISVLALPIFALCISFNLKKTAFWVLLFTIIVLFTFFNITALMSFLLAFLLFSCLVFIRFFKKKTLLIVMLIYFCISPIFLGNLNYKNLSDYQNEIETRFDLLQNKILNDYPFFYNNNINYSFYQMAVNAFKNSDKKTPIFLHSLNYYLLKLEEKIIHRRVIWSFSKEKILEKPIFGHGIFSSKVIGDQYKIKNIDNKILPAIPLHPHNNILQIWLELGAVGIILFYIFLCILINKIYQIKKINSQYAALSLASLFQIFLIGQFSYGFWQIWWISIIFINILIYNKLYKKLLHAK